MGLEIGVDLSGILRQLNALPEQAKEGVEDGLDEIKIEGNFAIERVADETYARPIRKLQNGNDAWERDGDLKSGQTAIRSTGELIFTTTGPAAEPITGYEGGYEERLADLPDGPDGINRSNNIKQKGYDIIQPMVAPKIEQAVANRIERL